MIKRLVVLIMVLLIYMPVNATSDTLNFVKVGWADEILGYDHYVPNESGVFSRSSRAYAYLEIAGYQIIQQHNLFLTNVAVDVVLRTRRGIPLYHQVDLVDYLGRDPYPPDSLWFYIWVDIPWWAPRGVYQAEVIVRDRFTGQILRETRELEIR